MEKLFTLLVKKLKQWKIQSKTLKEPTHICKSCFSDFEPSTFHGLFCEESLCLKCLAEFEPIFKKFKINEVEALAIYRYDEIIKKYIYIFKGCYDIELKSAFLGLYKNDLKSIFHGYILVPLPSSKSHDEKRGFNHVVEMFSILKMPMIRCLIKNSDHKQSDSNYHQRKEVINVLEVVDGQKIKDKKILIVDDICTTGSSLKAAIKLLKPYKPKELKALVLAKREFSLEEIKQIGDAIDILK